MRINIVCQMHEPHRIIPRLARQLADATGWSISARPDPSADATYALPYLEMRKRALTDGQPTAAYFTHREDILPAKVQIWRNQAAKVNLRLTSAVQYQNDLTQYGLTKIVTPPLDREAFSPGGARRARARLVAGVSGYRYSGGRKGEALLAEALQTPAGAAFEWRATGRGWPVRTRVLQQRELPDWYRDLDLYVCPSLYEGVPFGPLEALACGVPVVIPRGVGLLDELRDVPGIIHYDRGDAAACAQALREASDLIASGDIDREALRAATERFTEEAWVQDHISAFEELEAAAPSVTSAPLPFSTAVVTDLARESERGIYVVAYGAPARMCAQRLIASVRKHMPGVPVAVASETPLEGADVQVLHPDADLGGRTAKTRMWELAPASWTEVLYLDADTELVADVSFLFDALAAGWELVLTKDQDDYDTIYTLWRRDAQEQRVGRKEIGSERALQLAGGVVGFRRTEAVERFLKLWYTEWKVLAGRDQGALIRALYASPVRMLVLGCEWNSFVGVFKGETAGILHHRGGPARRQAKWNGRRLDDMPGWQRALRQQGRVRRVREPRRPRVSPIVQGKGSWFTHETTGARQFATAGSKVHQRFERSAAWRQEAQQKQEAAAVAG